MFAREMLNKIKWQDKRLDESVVVSYTHRGAPDNTAHIKGDKITDLKKSFFYNSETGIPYHRITRITYDGKIVFERKGKT